MANEYLKRTPTSTGNTKKYTLSFWVKNNDPSQGYTAMIGAGKTSPNNIYNEVFYDGNNSGNIGLNLDNAADPENYVFQSYINGSVYAGGGRDPASWAHYVVSFDNTIVDITSDPGVHIYKNGSEMKISETTTLTYLEKSFFNDKDYIHYIGTRAQQEAGTNTFDGEFFDVYMVDGQALTPDVFGFYKEGKGYISAGSTNATDFRSGQWSPRAPKSIKYEINRRGGFGVNGFYLPMNDSSNFGADFHTTPNSIIKLKGEDLPQPRNGAPDTSDAYVSELRDDPYAANLILACPFISGGYGQNGTVSTTISGLGDYHIALGGPSSVPAVNFLAGNGTQARITSDNGLYYGSSLDVTASTIRPRATVGTAFEVDGDYTIEFWAYINSFDATGTHLVQYDTDAGQTGWAITGDNGGARFFLRDSNNIDYQVLVSNVYTTGQWNHWAGVYEQSKNKITLYLNGVAVGTNTAVPSNYTSIQYSNLNRLHIGSNTGDGSRAMLGYIQDLRVYKGVAKYTGGFDVPKPYTPVGIESWRALPDTTANNFATFNPIMISSNGSNTTYNQYTLTNGNLSAAPTVTNHGVSANFSLSSGKWYWEMRVDTFFADNLWMGILDYNFGGGGTVPLPADSNYWITSENAEINLYGSGGTVYRGSSTTATGTTYAENDIIGFGLDLDTDGNKTPRLTFYKNGIGAHTSTGSMSGEPIGLWRPAVTFGGNGADWLVTANFGQNPTFSHKRAVFGKRVNTGNADSIWHQSSNGGTHTDWTISADGTNLQVTVPTGAYARAYLLASDGTIDPKKRYLVTFDYVTGPANLGVQASNSGGPVDYLTALDGSVSPNGLSSGNSYAFEFQGDQFSFTGFQLSTYELDNVIISEIGDAYTDDSGKGKFSYQPPSGFLALCEDNLPTPAIANPGDYFKTVLWTGDGKQGRSITGVGFQPDLVWLKTRTAINDNHKLIDTVRGATKTVYSNLTQSELTESTGLLSFDADGFTIGSDSGNNGSGRTFVAWCWKAGGPAVTNNNGTVASQVSANQDAGFSIVSYTANSDSTATIGHGLGKELDFIIVRNRDFTQNWYVYHSSLGPTYRSSLNLVDPSFTVTGVWNGTAPSSTVFSTVQDPITFQNGDRHIAYCWAEIEGFSKFGSFIGNGDADGPFVYCGFKPAWILIRQTGASQWNILDSSRQSTNPVNYTLLANDALVENTPSTRVIDFLSNGFKIRSNSGDINANQANVIFAAFAESPFQTANAK